jgi:glucokinase
VSEGEILVGDVGGTHARFAVVEHSGKALRIARRLDLDAKFAQFEGAIRACLDRIGSVPSAASIAVAGPVTNGSASFTNRGWHASESGLKAMGFRYALLINDFAALAFGAHGLRPQQLRTIGPDLSGIADEPISIVGAGTGFGVSCLARYRGRQLPVATEGGHIGFAPSNGREIDVLRKLERRFGRVSVERILSGPGLENLFGALGEIDGRAGEPIDAAEIQLRAEAGDVACAEAVSMFCAIFGAVAGDIALAHGARGGVFIAGGVAQKLEKHLVEGEFRARFESKGRLDYFVKPVPTRLILSEDVAFLGAAQASLEFRETSS